MSRNLPMGARCFRRNAGIARRAGWEEKTVTSVKPLCTFSPAGQFEPERELDREFESVIKRLFPETCGERRLNQSAMRRCRASVDYHARFELFRYVSLQPCRVCPRYSMTF